MIGKKSIGTAIVVVLVASGVTWQILNRTDNSESVNATAVNQVSGRDETNQTSTSTPADQAGKNLSANRCEGTDKPLLTHLPMNLDDFSMITPYGLMAGGHVTPIDHQYFEPVDRSLGIDAYPVYAMADSRIVAISTRPRTAEDGTAFLDYRIIFMMSCRLLYYYDLVTSLAPDLQAAYEQEGNAIDVAVQGGQLIGYIGAQTLDFAVWDTENPLTGYIVSEHYAGESWKIYTADPLDYYTDELKEQALSKYIRTAEPRSGKIDYDIDGKLIGNWFQQNADGTTNGYSGGARENYWTTHLSFSPDHLDPNGFIISIGNWPDGASQFAAKGNAPDPATVGVDNGLVKYDLTQINYRVGDEYWDRMSFAPPITFEAGSNSLGCILVRLSSDRELTAEAFKGMSCSKVNGFTEAAVRYSR